MEEKGKAAEETEVKAEVRLCAGASEGQSSALPPAWQARASSTDHTDHAMRQAPWH
jgi:hypothetical protein